MMPTQSADNEPRADLEGQELVDATHDRAMVCQKLIDDAVNGKILVPEFIQALRELGLNAAEAQDHVDKVLQRIELRRAKARNQNPVTCEPLPGVGRTEENAEYSHAQAVKEAAWEALQGKLDHAFSTHALAPSITIEQLAELLGEPRHVSGSSTVLQSVLTAVPSHCQDIVFVSRIHKGKGG
ncbi:hypothetical protein C0993_008251 [Termitomyces sp. T159_Od127]|nr:hypothetical protein C0993_008251 [Termitomyces sp. T159_Od127]